MAGRNQQSFIKRQRERMKQEKAAQKAEKRKARSDAKKEPGQEVAPDDNVTDGSEYFYVESEQPDGPDSGR
jgi:hypothetical protein